MADPVNIPQEPDSPKVNPLDYMSRTEWYGNGTTPAARWMAEQPQALFEAALAEARAEGNLSRTNIARKMGWQSPDQRRARRNLTAEERGYGAMSRLLAAVDPAEMDEWLTGALAAVEDGRK